MDYEKAYKEALERARRKRDFFKSTFPKYDYDKEIEDIFPELSESEDEKTRKEMIETFKGAYEGNGVPIPFNRFPIWIAWLEKQKPVEWSEKDSNNLKETIYFIKEFQKSNRCKNENDMQNSVTCEKWLESITPQPKAKEEWSDEDEKIMLNIVSDGVRKVGLDESQIKWLKSLKEKCLPQPKQ